MGQHVRFDGSGVCKSSCVVGMPFFPWWNYEGQVPARSLSPSHLSQSLSSSRLNSRQSLEGDLSVSPRNLSSNLPHSLPRHPTPEFPQMMALPNVDLPAVTDTRRSNAVSSSRLLLFIHRSPCWPHNVARNSSADLPLILLPCLRGCLSLIGQHHTCCNSLTYLVASLRLPRCLYVLEGNFRRDGVSDWVDPDVYQSLFEYRSPHFVP